MSAFQRENPCIAGNISKEWPPQVQGKVCFLMTNYRVPLPDVLFVGAEFNFYTLVSQYLKEYLLLGM